MDKKLAIISYKPLNINLENIDCINISKNDDINEILLSVDSDYVLFCLNDDIIINTLEKALKVINEVDSDIFIFPGYRRDINVIWNEDIFVDLKLNTNFKINPKLVNDTNISSKIYKTEFLLKTGLKFLPIYYKEQFFVIESYVKSNKISIFKDVLTIINIFNSRQKDIRTLEKLEQKIYLFKRIDKLLKENQMYEAIKFRNLRALNTEFSEYIDYLQNYPELQRLHIIRLIKNYLSGIEIPFLKLNVYDRLKYYFLMNNKLDELRELQTFYYGTCSIEESKIIDDFRLQINSQEYSKNLFDRTNDLEIKYKLKKVEVVDSYLIIEGWSYIQYIDICNEKDIVKELIFKGENIKTTYNLKNILLKELIKQGCGVNFYDYAGFESVIQLSNIKEDCDVFLKLKSNNIIKEVYLFRYKYKEKALVVENAKNNLSDNNNFLSIKDFKIENNKLTLEIGNDLYYDNISYDSVLFTKLAFVDKNTNKVYSLLINDNNSEIIFKSCMIKSCKNIYKKCNKILKLEVNLDKINIPYYGLFDMFLQLGINGNQKNIPLKYFYKIDNKKDNSNKYNIIITNNQLTMIVNKELNTKLLLNENRNLKKKISILQNKVNYIENSKSWKITKPLRYTLKRLKNLTKTK